MCRSSVIDLGNVLLSGLFSPADIGSLFLVVRDQGYGPPNPRERGGSKPGALSQGDIAWTLSNLDLTVRVGRPTRQPGDAARKNGSGD